ncbi:DUF927 domain-containing protein [Paraburkholderia caribensis]|uniref:DUF927 domain-containing protein n=1 Tax=Paraburkholderia caribensis TaxID=75105 RepID=UPI001CAC7D03|nr:DUF927 domain-containing protein [Paraburkholderia caribensis]CAG9269367.1 Putative DNA primase/helicase [Paraburkholderia caribensis]
MNMVIDDFDRIRNALSCIPPDVDRDTWFRVAAAIKDALGEEGFELFETWSRGDPGYIERDVRDTWRSLQAGRGITIGTLIAIAKQHGYRPHSASGVGVVAAPAQRRRVKRDERIQDEELQRLTKRKHAATLARVLIEKSTLATDDHPYLRRKGVQATGMLREIVAERLPMLLGYMPRSGGEVLEGRILVAPVSIAGAVTTVEMIDEKGRKSALARGAKAGGGWFASELPEHVGRVLIGEGVATMLSAHLCTGDPAVAALSAGNLPGLAKAVRAAHADADLVILADLGNGQSKAVEAAHAVGGRLALPDFGDGRDEDDTDFNDLHVRFGQSAVEQQISAATAPSGINRRLEPDENTRDGCVPRGFNVTDDGVYYREDDGTPNWICSTLHVRALVRDRASENWGRLLEWTDADNHPHVWAMPMEMLRSDGADMRGELARLGLDIAPGARARNKLTEYITTAKPKARGRCVTRTGWHNGAFVFPDQTIGETSERAIFQAEAVMRTYSHSGTIDDWKRDVARYCSGNSRLLVAVSTAFAGMLLAYSGQESGGLNLVGDSSTGKTTALRAACSVFGGPEYMQRWRATSNGLEALAALHNDTLLVLDELAQVEPREAGEIAYMLANGSGKARAGRSGSARPRQSWRLLFLSAGEIGLAQHMQTGGKRAKAGQEVRLVELPADAGKGHGLFEDLHGASGGAQFSSIINEGCARSFGTAAIEFLKIVTSEAGIMEAYLKKGTSRFLEEYLPADASGQAHRVCQRFALIAQAGEYATQRGITGWKRGEALAAAGECFRAWLNGRGGAGSLERTQLLSAVKAFFESHEEARFTDLSAKGSRPTTNRAGYRRSTEKGVEYLLFPEVFKREICLDCDPKLAARLLIEAGWLKPAGNGWAQRTERLPEKGPTKVYVFTSAMWSSC